MAMGRESDDLEGAIERARLTLDHCRAALASSNSLLDKTDQLLAELGEIIHQLEGQTNGHQT